MSFLKVKLFIEIIKKNFLTLMSDCVIIKLGTKSTNQKRIKLLGNYTRKFKELTKVQVFAMSDYAYVSILQDYIMLCTELGVDADDFYLIPDVEQLEPKHMWILVNIISIYWLAVDMLGRDFVKEWLTRKRRTLPFVGTSPLEFMKGSATRILETRFYLNALTVDFKEAWGYKDED